MVRALLVLVALSLGCNSEHPTIGEGCDDLAGAFCARTVQCDPTQSYNACFQSWKKTCCLDSGTCDQESKRTQKWVDKCTEAVSGELCADVLSSTLPAQCLTD